MTQQKLADMLYNHKYTEKENAEAKEIADICAREGCDFISAGCPLYIKRIRDDGAPIYRAGTGDGYVSVVAIEKSGYGFDYYIVDVGETGDWGITDFQVKWLPKYEEKVRRRYNDCAIPFDCLLYYLLHTKLFVDDKPDKGYVMYERYCLKATLDEASGKYRLNPLHGYGCGMANDEVMQYGCRFDKPVFELIQCPHCYERFAFDDTAIPVGGKYEISCPNCDVSLMRKKV